MNNTILKFIFGYIAVILLAYAVSGCITPQPIRLVTYEFDQKSQQWKRMTCMTSVRGPGGGINTDCRMDLAAPPTALETSK